MKTIIKKLLPNSYIDVYRILRSYIQQYGGLHQILKSPYLHLAIFLSAITFSTWVEEGWWNIPIAILPSLISFTLAGYALFLALGNDTFRQMMAGKEGSTSPLLSISATFVHFILLQTFALILALIAQSRPISSIVGLLSIAFFNTGYPRDVRIVFCHIFWFISFSAFLYSITSIVAITMSLFRVARWLNIHHLTQQEPGHDKKKQ